MDNSNIYINADALKARIMASPIFRNFGADGEFIRDFILDIIETSKESGIKYERLHNSKF